MAGEHLARVSLLMLLLIACHQANGQQPQHVIDNHVASVNTHSGGGGGGGSIRDGNPPLFGTIYFGGRGGSRFVSTRNDPRWNGGFSPNRGSYYRGSSYGGAPYYRSQGGYGGGGLLALKHRILGNLFG